MGIRTKGTVKLELKSDKAFRVSISPVPSHAVNNGKQEFIVFIEAPTPISTANATNTDTPPPTPATKTNPSPVTTAVFAKGTQFDVPEFFQSALIAAATQSICVEIEIDSQTNANIVGLSIPSTDR